MKKLIFTFISLLCFIYAPHFAHATAFYADALTGSDSNDGLSTTTPWNSLQRFMTTARSAGDCLFLKRNASTTNQVPIAVLSSGDINNPICVSGDFDNLWNGFATSSETLAPTFGETYIATSASTTTLFPGQFFYIQSDCFETYNSTTLNTCQYSYEVNTASSTGISLFLPYDGTQAGSGKKARVMGIDPTLGSPTNPNNLTFSNDNNWRIKGLRYETTNGSCAFNLIVQNFHGEDLVLVGAGGGDCGVGNTLDKNTILERTRIFNVASGVNGGQGITLSKVLVNCNGTSNARAIQLIVSPIPPVYLNDVYFQNCTSDFIGANNIVGTVIGRNFNGNGQFATWSGSGIVDVSIKDPFGKPNTYEYFNQFIAVNNNTSTTTSGGATNLRAGGGPMTLLVRPPSGTADTGVSATNLPTSGILLFDTSAWNDGTSRTYSMFVQATSSTAFTSNPTASQLWIDCEYYGSATKAERIIKGSTGTVNFTGSTAWQSISVTCQPAQAGEVRVRAWYTKPKETPSNFFFVDASVVVTTP